MASSLSPKQAYVDTNVIIRLVTGDDPKKQERSARLFEKVERGEIVLSAPDTAIADTVFVLSSPKWYNLKRDNIRDILSALLTYTNFKVDNKKAVLTALDLYAASSLDFGDCILASLTLESKTKTIYSYDRDFDKIKGLTRKSP